MTKSDKEQIALARYIAKRLVEGSELSAAPAMSVTAYDEKGDVVFTVPLGPKEINRLAKVMDLGDRKSCYPLMARLPEKLTLFVEA